MGFNMDNKVLLAKGIYAVVGTYNNAKGDKSQYALQIGGITTDSDTGRERFKDNSIFIGEHLLVGEVGQAVGQFLTDVFKRIAAGTDAELKQAQARVKLAESKKNRDIASAKADLDDIINFCGSTYTDYDTKTKKSYDSALKTLKELDPELAKEYIPRDEDDAE